MPSRIRMLLLISLSVAVLTAAAWRQILVLTGWGLPERDGPAMLVVAHRGHMAAYAEDSAEAVWDAARRGADGIEFDVHRSADGTWWLVHDDRVDRTTDGVGRVCDMADSELGELRVTQGPGYAPGAPPVGLSRLTDVLAGLDGYRGRIYADIQHATCGDAGSLAAALDGHVATVIARDDADIARVRRASSRVGVIIRPGRWSGEHAPDGYLLEAVSETSVEAVDSYDLPITTYTDELYWYLDERAVLRRAWALGAEAFLAKQLVPALEERDRLDAQRLAGPPQSP